MSLLHVSRSFLLCSTVLSALCVDTVFAESLEKTDTEVIITALRKSEPLSKAPVSASLIKGAQLKAFEMYDLKSLQTLTPSLLITSTANEAQTTARLRGVGTVGDNPGLESSVGVMIDGVMRARTATAMSDLGIVDRVEVLKGPQSGYYGKGASAGLIAVYTKAPGNEHSHALDLTYGEYGTMAVSAYAEGAVSDTINGSVSFAHRQRDGQYKIKTGEGPRTETEDNNQNYDSLRGQLLFIPNDRFQGRLIADYTKRSEACCSGVGITIGGTRAYIDQLASDDGTASSINPDGRQAWLNRSTKQVIIDSGVSFEAKYDIAKNLKLISLTAARHWDHKSGYDADFTSTDIYYRDPDGSFGNEFNTLSQELRLEGGNDRLNFVVGLYADSEKLTRHDQYLYGPDYEPYMGLLLSGGSDINLVSTKSGLSIGSSFVAGEGANDVHNQSTQNLAFFNAFEFAFDDHFSVLTNLRYSHQDKRLKSHYTTSDKGIACASAKALGSSGLGVLCLPWSNPAFTDLSLIQKNTSDATTGSLRLKYQRPYHMAYISYATGWKGAGYQLDREQLSNFAADLDTSFKAETSQSLEIGYKYNRGPLNWTVAAFDEGFENFQLNTFIGTTFLVRSVPHLNSKGIELEAAYTLGDLKLSGGITYNEGRFGPEAVAGLPLLANNTPSFAPRYSGVINGDWHRDIGAHVLKANLNTRYMGEYNTGSDLLPIKIQKAYSLYNGALSYGARDESWEILLWGQNLTDVLYYQVAFSAPFQAGTYNAFVGQPRTLGLTLRLKR